jgi:GxxExxY protein
MLDIAKYKDECFDVIGAIYNVKRELGPGLNEKIYQEGLAMELSLQKIPFEREKPIHPVYRGKQMESIFFLDFFCKGTVIVELKSVASLNKEHRAQLYNYMQLVKPMVGVLVNFAPLYAEIERYYYDNELDLIVNSDGRKLRNRYDDNLEFHSVR